MWNFNFLKTLLSDTVEQGLVLEHKNKIPVKEIPNRFPELWIEEFKCYENYLIDKTNPVKLFEFIFSEKEKYSKIEYLKTHLYLSDVIKLSFKEKNSILEYDTTFGQEFYIRFTLATAFLAYFTKNDEMYRNITMMNEINPEEKLIIYADLILEDSKNGKCLLCFIYQFYDLEDTLTYERNFKIELTLDMDLFKSNPFLIYTNFIDVDNEIIYKYSNLVYNLLARKMMKHENDSRNEVMTRFWLTKCLAIGLIQEELDETDVEAITYRMSEDGSVEFKSKKDILFSLYDKNTLEKINSYTEYRVLKNHSLLLIEN